MPKPFYSNDLASPAYREMLHEMHQSAPWGTKGYKYSQDIRQFILELNAPSQEVTPVTILDYGCGQCSLAEHNLDLAIRSYDPGIPEWSDMPEPADLVVCTDVLQHIEPDLIYNVLRHIAELAQMGIYLHIATKPAKRLLPDGRNAHLIVEGCEWWLTKLATISDRWKVRNYVSGSKTLKFWLVRN